MRKHPHTCQCGGAGSIERGPAGATFSYPCYPWDCKVKGCACKIGTDYEDTAERRLRLAAAALCAAAKIAEDPEVRKIALNAMEAIGHDCLSDPY